MISKETIRAYRLTNAAVEVLEQAGVSDAGVDEDFVNLVGDGTALLDSCLACADEDRAESWCEYVACLVASRPRSPSPEEERRIISNWLANNA
jgi:hypothetical protein